MDFTTLVDLSQASTVMVTVLTLGVTIFVGRTIYRLVRKFAGEASV